MSSNVLRFQPEQTSVAIDPLQQLFASLQIYIDSQVEKRVSEALKTKDAPKRIVDERYVSAKDVAKHFGWSMVTINDKADRAEIPCLSYTRGGRTFRKFKISEVEKALEAK